MAEQALIVAEELTRRFAGAAAPAIDGLSARVGPGRVTGLVGPDGAGKTTLLRLFAGLLLPDAGRLTVCGSDTRTQLANLRRSVSYMPQRFGLYEDLSVRQNLDLYADLRGVVGREREETYDRLLAFTDLHRFTGRLAGKLSGGMKQKLGLACALIRTPALLLLDEPSVGVDPISRRELWKMVYALVDRGIGVVWSTAYLDEAERCAEVVLLNAGKVHYAGPPRDLTARLEGRTFLVAGASAGRRRLLARALRRPEVVDGVIQGSSVRLVLTPGAQPPAPRELGAEDALVLPTPPRFEDAFVDLLGGSSGKDESGRMRDESERSSFILPPLSFILSEDVVEADGLTKRFGDFTAADHISFRIRRGEIFGLLGPNGAGKSTTFKMMCGLLRPTAGRARVAGLDLYRAAGAARARLGYMAQKFSLYGDLSVRQNLHFFAGVYGLSGQRRREAIERVVGGFDLGGQLDQSAGELPLGFKQRLALACAIMHEPPVLFLDEPTSGVDPLTRREFWSHINAMVERGVTVLVTTHFLDEAEYCDRIGLVYRGRVIAEGSPDELKAQARTEGQPEPTLEDAFIALVETSDSEGDREKGRRGEGEIGRRGDREKVSPSPYLPISPSSSDSGRLRRVAGLIRKEGLQILRDPSSFLIAGVLPLLLLFIFAFGVSLDLRRVPVGVVVEQATPEADSFLASFRNSRYFEVRLARDRREVEGDLVSGRLKGVVVLAADFSDRLGRGETAPIQVLVDGSDPNTAGLVQFYVQGLWSNWAQQESASRAGLADRPRAAPLVRAAPRFWFNPNLDSRYALLPGAVAIVLTLIGTLLTSLVVAREWERGTMEALLATPVSPGELLVGKVVPYFALGMGAMVLSVSVTVFLLGVPFRGSVLALVAVSSAYLAVMLALGLLISTVTRNQFAASQAAIISAFLPAFELSGFIFEIDSMAAPVRLLTYVLPARYFVSSLQTLFLAGDVSSVLLPNGLVLVGMAAILFLALWRVTRVRLPEG